MMRTFIRATAAVAAGLIVWAVIATALDVLLRFALPGYAAAEPYLAAAEPQLKFTLGMMIARLALPGAIPSIGAGFVAARIARGDRRVIAALIVILLALFLPSHFRLWTILPVWYHVTFLGSLVVLTLLGARLARAFDGGVLSSSVTRAAN